MKQRESVNWQAVEHAETFLRSVDHLSTQILGAAQELIGHQNAILDAEWEFYEQVQRVTCPWVHKDKAADAGWTPYREPEAMFENRTIALELLGRDTPLELAFGVSAISHLGSAGFIEHHLSGDPAYDPQVNDGFDAARAEAFGGVAGAMAAISLGRQLKNMPETKPIAEDDLKEYRRRLNKSAAEKRNEPFRQMHWAFRAYLAANDTKSIRNGAKLFYESLPAEKQIYQSVEHAVRNLSESLYGKRSRGPG